MLTTTSEVLYIRTITGRINSRINGNPEINSYPVFGEVDLLSDRISMDFNGIPWFPFVNRLSPKVNFSEH